MRVEKAQESWKSRNGSRLLNSSALPVTASSRELLSPTPPGHRHQTTFTKQLQAPWGWHRLRGDSSWKASGCQWDYPSAICNSRCSSLAWGAPCCINPSPQQCLRWVGSSNQRWGQGGSIKGSPSQHSRHNVMRQAQSGCSAGQSFNRLNNSISTDH